jgi:transposase
MLLETRYVKAAPSAMTVKTDRKDARGVSAVHGKSVDSQEVRALLVGRKLRQAKLLDFELSMRGIRRGFGLKVGEVRRGRIDARVRELADGNAMLEALIGTMLQARGALWNEFMRLHREMLKIARADNVCRRLMSAHGIGAPLSRSPIARLSTIPIGSASRGSAAPLRSPFLHILRTRVPILSSAILH